MHWTKRTCLALALLVPCVLHAEEADAPPIVIDLGDGSGESSLLVVAYRPTEQIVIIGDRAQLERAALRALEGRPEPSVVLGRVEPGAEETFGIETLLPDTVAAYAFPWDDLDTRAALRTEDPDLFEKLVSGGYLDPASDELVVALQTDLARMNCYSSGIDGDWGPGSQRSVTRYFEELGDGSSWPDQEATTELFRTILLQGDVACPEPVVQRPPSTTSTGNTTSQDRVTDSGTQRETTPDSGIRRNVPDVGVGR